MMLFKPKGCSRDLDNTVKIGMRKAIDIRLTRAV